MEAKNRKDIAGQKFGRLEIVKYSHTNKDRKAHWVCKCDCGKKVTASGKAMRTGKTLSCGCLQRERTGNAARTHGESKTRIHRIWLAMKNRSYNKNDRHWKWYGSKGVIVCAQWKDDYVAFREWAINNGYEKNLTIDRIDGNGNYEPSNCRWITIQDQQRNKSNNKKKHILCQ